MHLTAPDLATLENIRHGFFTREGGVSRGIYASMNCGPGSGDELENVLENRARAAESLGQLPDSLSTAYQIHSSKAFIVEEPWPLQNAPQADALVTSEPGITLGVLTADCLPILMADGKNRVIAAVHAGWKGAAGGVIEAAIAAMRELGAAPEHITAAIGPAIAQASYQVGPEFQAHFLALDAKNAAYFIPSSRQRHFQFDLPAYAKSRLAAAGVAAINSLARDTCLEENAFFSYRRNTLRGQAMYGRQLSAIVLEP